jgi:1,3-beta-galactosyl-N-acetylhexosamine phosphorylase
MQMRPKPVHIAAPAGFICEEDPFMDKGPFGMTRHAWLLLGVAMSALGGTVVFGSPEPARAESSPPEPIVTALQLDTDVEAGLARLRAMGCNHVWLSWGAENLAPRMREEGISPVILTHPSKKTPGTRDSSQWVHAYLKSFWKEKAEADLVLPLDEVCDPTRYHLDPQTESARIRVVERGTGRALPAAEWEADLQRKRVTVRGGTPGEKYRAIFPVAMVNAPHANIRALYPPRFTDGVSSPERRAIHYDHIRTRIENAPDAAVLRPTSLQYFWVHIREPAVGKQLGDYIAWSWYAYWAGMNPARFALYEKRYGEAFDPLWIMERGYGEEGYLPHPAYRRWIDLMREEVIEYARGMNEIIREADRRSRWFWGDDWLGIEPWLGDVDRVGFDEVVSSLNAGPGMIRRMGFPSEARRIVRLPWVDLNRDHPEVFDERWAEHWRWIRRELFYRCPDGITAGGDVRGAFEAGGGESIVNTMQEFRTIHGRIFRKRLYKNDGLTFYVADAWGAMRSWAVPTHYQSRTETFKAILDWPVDIRFISFDEIASGGVPDDASLLLIAGEPGTAWAGGELWENEALVEAVRSYVQGGGGLLAMGGASLTGGKFALGDLLGIRYEAPATERAAEQLWNLTRWVDAGYPSSEFGEISRAYRMMRPELVRERLPAPLRGPFGMAAPGSLLCDTLVTAQSPESVIARDEEGRPAAVLTAPGRGRAGYVAGYSADPRFLKPLAFHLAGASDALARLDSDHPTVSVYAYPEEHLLIAFNYGARPAQALIRLDPVALGLASDGETFSLQDLDGGEDRSATARELREGLSLSLEPGRALYWRLERP